MFQRIGVGVMLAFGCTMAASEAAADCNISDAVLEQAILQKPEFRDNANRQMVSDLRTLRDAAFILWSYGLEDDCERILGNIRELIASPAMGSLGGNDEDEVDQQQAAAEPMRHQGGNVLGNRGDDDALPLIDINQLGGGLRVDEIVGAEVRSSDDKIIGEVRNVVIGTKDRWDYAVVASGGFFIPGKDSIVVPLRYLQINQERDSFFLRLPEAEVKKVPLMPDQDYLWLSDDAWRATNDAIFQRLIPLRLMGQWRRSLTTRSTRRPPEAADTGDVEVADLPGSRSSSQIHSPLPPSITSSRSWGKSSATASRGSTPRRWVRMTRPTPPWDTAKVGRSMVATQAFTRSRRSA